MARVYGGAAFTISADLAENTDHGILHERDLLRSHDFGQYGEMCLQEVEVPWADIQNQSVYWRGWVSVPRTSVEREHLLTYESSVSRKEFCPSESSTFSKIRYAIYVYVLLARVITTAWLLFAMVHGKLTSAQIAWECNTTLYREGFHGRESDPPGHIGKFRFTKQIHQKPTQVHDAELWVSAS
jgi:hypothetical protein